MLYLLQIIIPQNFLENRPKRLYVIHWKERAMTINLDSLWLGEHRTGNVSQDF